jgi:hypothetical protein
MPSSIVSPFPVFNDLDGTPLEAGYIYIGQSNLNPESAPINVFWDAALTVPAAQPIRTVGGYASRNGSPSRMYVSADTYSITVRNRNRVFVFAAFDQTDAPTSVFDISTQVITATAGQVTFALTVFTYLPGTDTLQVYRNGLRLTLGTDYLETNSSTVTLTTAAAAGDEFLFQGGAVVTGNQVPGSQVSFVQAGTGVVTRNMQDKVRESVSVKDFGAVGDGIADDTVAIQAAINFCQTNGRKLFIPSGDYKSDSLYVTANPGIVIEGESPAAYPSPLSGLGGGVRFFYTGTGDFLNFNVGTSFSTFIYRVFCSNFTIFFKSSSVNSGIRMHNIQESIFRNISIQGKFDGSQTIANAFLLDSAGITAFDSCISSFVVKVFNCTGQVGGQVTGSLNVTNCNFFRVTNVLTGGSTYYSINFYSNWFEGFQTAFLFDTSQSYNGISIGNFNIDTNTFLQTTLGLTQTRVLKVTSSNNSLPINFYVNMRGNFCDMAGLGGGVTQPSFAIEIIAASNTSTVNGLFNCEDNVFWNVLNCAFVSDVNAIRFLNSGNDSRSGIYGSTVVPYCPAGTVSGFSSSTLAAETADYSAANSTTELVLKTINVPKDFFTEGRALSLMLYSTYLNTTGGNKTIRVRIGGLTGTTIATFINSVIGKSRIDLKIGVTNNGFIKTIGTQVTDSGSVVPLVQDSIVVIPAGAIQKFTITGQVANSSDNVALNMYQLTLE